ncbi:MAG: HD-GYP domain-containing protein [Candidatus Omnitrophota bacterium]
MDFLLYVFFAVLLFVGIFIGYAIRAKEEKMRQKRIWTRVERRNIMRTINALVSAIDFKDHLTKNHSDNVKHYACAIAEEMGLSMTEIKEIQEACQVHDLGKIGIHDNILLKPDSLTEKEYQEIKSHSLAGAIILKPFHFLKKVVKLVRQHHERYDGTGYPDGLSGKNIDLGARIMSVADSFDAMTQDRPYRDAMTQTQAIEELRMNSGTQFDPKVVEAFLKVLEKKPDIIKRKGEIIE